MDIKKNNKNNNKQDDGHVIFIDRLTDFHIQRDKKEKKKQTVKENKKSR